MSGDLPEVRSALVKQATDIIDEETTAVDLVVQLDVSRYRHTDSSGSRGDSTGFEAMFKAVLLRELKEWSDSELHRKLDTSEIGERLGFDPDKVPCRSTLYRARTSRFEDAERIINRSVEQIQELARERGSPIGRGLEPEESDNTSQRNERREIRRRTREVIEEMENVVFPVLDLPQSDDAIYDKDDLLMVETLAGVLDDVGLNGAGDAHGDILDPEGELDHDDPFYEDGPTGETVLRSVKQLSPTAISGMVNRAARKCYTRVKHYEEFTTPVRLAIDITYVAYYGERDEMVRVQGIKGYEAKEYDWCHKFATANVVGDNTHFVVAMLPVGDPDHHNEDAYPGQEKSYRPGAVVRDLLEIVDDLLSVRVVYADKEFFAAESIAALEDHDLMYVIPIPESKRDVGPEDADDVWVKQEHMITGPVKHGVTNEQVWTSVVVLPPDEDYDSTQAFATNLSVSDEIGRRHLTRLKIKRYKKRAGIETAYSKIKEFGGMTTSRSYPVRLFHFGMAVLLYDMWLLVDFLVQISMEGEFRSKPRVTAERFRKFIERLLEELRSG